MNGITQSVTRGDPAQCAALTIRCDVIAMSTAPGKHMAQHVSGGGVFCTAHRGPDKTHPCSHNNMHCANPEMPSVPPSPVCSWQ